MHIGRYNKYFFQDPKNSLLSRFFVILVRSGVKTRDLDILWQKNQFLAVWHVGK